MSNGLLFQGEIMRSLFSKAAVFLSLLFAFGGSANVFAQSNDKMLSFDNKVSLSDIASGKITKSLRLKDRSVAPYSYAVGKELTLINASQSEDNRTPDQQALDNTYGKVQLTGVKVAVLSALSADEQKEVKKFYTELQIAEANNIITILSFKFIK
jgi:hypothetical protein